MMRTALLAEYDNSMTRLELRRLRDQIRAIVFDMDGVLADTSAIHASAYRQVLAPYNIPFRYEDYAGMRTRDCLRALFSSNRVQVSEDELDELGRRKTQLALETLRTVNPIVPEAKRVLKHLHGRYLLALASSGSAVTVRTFVQRNALEELFVSILTGADSTEAKPMPEIYQKSFNAIGVPAVDAIVIEDAVNGVRAARAAGAIVVGVIGTSSPDALIRAGADLVIERLEELLCL